MTNFWGFQDKPKQKKQRPLFEIQLVKKSKTPLIGHFSSTIGGRPFLFGKPIGNRYKKFRPGWSHQGHTFERERTSHIKMMSPEKFLRTTKKQFENPKTNIGIELTKNYKSMNMKEYEEGEFENDYAKKNIEKLRSIIKNKTEDEDNNVFPTQGKMEIPYLLYDEHGRPIGHEGRHRAMAAIAEGIPLIPVTIGKKLKEPRDWEDQRKLLGNKNDWKLNLENEDEIISSKSADISIEAQRRYGIEDASGLQALPGRKYKFLFGNNIQTKRHRPGRIGIKRLKQQLFEVDNENRPEEKKENAETVHEIEMEELDDARKFRAKVKWLTQQEYIHEFYQNRELAQKERELSQKEREQTQKERQIIEDNIQAKIQLMQEEDQKQEKLEQKQEKREQKKYEQRMIEDKRQAEIESIEEQKRQREADRMISRLKDKVYPRERTQPQQLPGHKFKNININYTNGKPVYVEMEHLPIKNAKKTTTVYAKETTFVEKPGRKNKLPARKSTEIDTYEDIYNKDVNSGGFDLRNTREKRIQQILENEKIQNERDNEKPDEKENEQNEEPRVKQLTKRKLLTEIDVVNRKIQGLQAHIDKDTVNRSTIQRSFKGISFINDPNLMPAQASDKIENNLRTLGLSNKQIAVIGVEAAKNKLTSDVGDFLEPELQKARGIQKKDLITVKTRERKEDKKYQIRPITLKYKSSGVPLEGIVDYGQKNLSVIQTVREKTSPHQQFIKDSADVTNLTGYDQYIMQKAATELAKDSTPFDVNVLKKSVEVGSHLKQFDLPSIYHMKNKTNKAHKEELEKLTNKITDRSSESIEKRLEETLKEENENEKTEDKNNNKFPGRKYKKLSIFSLRRPRTYIHLQNISYFRPALQ